MSALGPGSNRKPQIEQIFPVCPRKRTFDLRVNDYTAELETGNLCELADNPLDRRLALLLVTFWLDNFLRGDSRAPLLVIAGAWLSATVTVALAEEVAELLQGFRSAQKSMTCCAVRSKRAPATTKFVSGSTRQNPPPQLSIDRA